MDTNTQQAWWLGKPQRHNMITTCHGIVSTAGNMADLTILRRCQARGPVLVEEISQTPLQWRSPTLGVPRETTHPASLCGEEWGQPQQPAPSSRGLTPATNTGGERRCSWEEKKKRGREGERERDREGKRVRERETES